MKMPRRDVVVIGASAGGLEAVSAIVKRLSPALPACVLVVVHSSANAPGVLPDILRRHAAVPVAFARDGDPIEPGRIYVARPDFHLVVESARVAVVHGPRENGFRPAIDPLFRTAARAFGPRVIGVILSGALSDGVYGLSVIKQHGGVSIVQEPSDALVPGMPASALENVTVDHVLPAAKIPAMLERLAGRVSGPGGADMAPNDIEPQQPTTQTEVDDMNRLFGLASGLTCPDCGGALWEVTENRVLRYQCHVGHQYSAASLDAGQRDAIDSALWSAVRVLEEHRELKLRMSRRAEANGMPVVSRGFAEGARDAHEQAQRIRTLLFSRGSARAEAADTAPPNTPGEARARRRAKR